MVLSWPSLASNNIFCASEHCSSWQSGAWTVPCCHVPNSGLQHFLPRVWWGFGLPGTLRQLRLSSLLLSDRGATSLPTAGDVVHIRFGKSSNAVRRRWIRTPQKKIMATEWIQSNNPHRLIPVLPFGSECVTRKRGKSCCSKSCVSAGKEENWKRNQREWDKPRRSIRGWRRRSKTAGHRSILRG